MRRRLALLLTFGLLLSVSPALASPPRLVRVAIFSLPPLIYQDETKTAQGLYPDLLREIGRANNFRVEFVPCVWADCLARVASGGIDLLPAAGHAPDGAAKLDLSREPVIDIWGQVYVRSGSKINTILDLDNETVGLMRKDINGRNFRETATAFGVRCRIIEFDSHEEIFQAVQEKRVTAGVAPHHYGLRHAPVHDLVGSSIIFSPFSVSFATRKGDNAELLARIDEQLRHWKKKPDSLYHRSLNHWLEMHEYRDPMLPRWLRITLAVSVGAALALVFFVLLLKRQVSNRTRELRVSEKHYRDLVESANSVILGLDREGRVLFLNRFGLDLFGFTEEEIVGKSVMGTIVPERESSGRDLRFMINDILRQPNKYLLTENENICRDGRRLFIQWSNRPIFDQRGNFQELLSVGTDITDRKRLENELRQSQKMEAIGTLAGGIAHDFNNILAAIMGFAELARLDEKNGAPVRSHVEQIIKASKRAKGLVQQILSFSRKTKHGREPLLVQPLLKEALKMLRASIPTTIEIREEIDPDCGAILANPTQIHQVLLNLCTNAAHAMEEQGGVCTVRLARVLLAASDLPNEPGLEPGTYLQLTVHDTGPGIPPGVVNRIFEPYFTTKGDDKGSGMGLAVVYGIVKEYQGIMRVESKPGAGTSFQVFFPEVAALPQPAAEEVAALPTGSERLLVIDDEQAIIDVTSQSLGKLGYRVTATTDPREALRLFAAHPEEYDLVITDQTMPYHTGMQLAREFLARRPDLPIVLCTGYSSMVDEEKAHAAGIAAFALKPIDAGTMAQMVRAALARKPPAARHT